MKLSNAVLLVILLSACLLFEEIDAQRGRRRNRQRRLRPIPIIDPVVPVVPPAPVVPRDCGPIPHVTNGQGLETGNTVNYACQPGFRLEGTNVITCIDGRWTVAPRCVRELCMAPPNIAFANSPQLTNSGTRATYTCDPGYTIQGSGGQTSRTVDCDINSQSWPTLPSCEAASATQVCQAPPIVDNASRQISGNTAIYICDTGYIRVAGTPAVLICSGTSWVGGTPACTRDPSVTQPPPQCTRAPPCGGANVNRPSNVADSYAPGSKVTYTCSTGYRIAGQNDNKKNTQDVECKTDGTWTSVPTCEPVVCGLPPSGTNTNNVVTTATTFGSTYKYTCINLYEISSDVTVICQADGTWSQGAPTCTRKVCKFSAIPSVTNGSPQGITTNADTLVGNNVTIVCNTDYRVAPLINNANANTIQSILCQENGTFTTPRSCVYKHPTSCVDHYKRDNNLPSLGTNSGPTTVTIDPDGPATTNSEAAVSCSVKADGQVCTSIAPSSGASLGASALTCNNGGSLGTVFGNAALKPANANDFGIGVCNSVKVGYPLSKAQITSAITSSNSCVQKVTISCTGANKVFLGLRRIDDTQGTGFGAFGVEPGATAFSAAESFHTIFPVADYGVCDCYYSGSPQSDSCVTQGCKCTDDASATGTDTITIPLNANAVDYVDEYGVLTLVTNAANPTVTNPSANQFAVTIGSIECCVKP